VLGIGPALPGFETIAATPDLAGLDHAEGIVPTVRGDVEVRLERDGEATIVQIRLDADAPLDLRAPAGQALAGPPKRHGDRVEARLVSG
jgi:hypothetical protein